MQPEDPRDLIIAQLQKQIAEQQALIAEQQAQIVALTKRVAELEERLGRNSSNSSKPPSSDPPWAKPKPKPKKGKKRKRGGQHGHPRHERPLVPPDKVDRIVKVKPCQCSCCGRRLLGNDTSPERHQVFELPKIEAKVTEYQIHTLGCACGVHTKGELPAAVRRAFGPNLVALVCWLTGKFRLSKRGVQELLSDLLRTNVSLGAVSKMEREVSAALAAPVEDARAYVRGQDVAHADETGWRECNKKAWLWVAVTPLVAVFEIARSRGAKVAKHLLGDKFAGVLVSDRWSAYTFVPSEMRQLCWAHLLRDFQALVERGGPSKRLGKALLGHARQMFKWWHKVRDGTMSRETFQRKMMPVIDQVEELLVQGARCRTPRTAGTCAHILDLQWALWTFVFVEGVEPTNNTAERVIRSAVLWRKTSFGTQSEAGSRFVERILTATSTLKLQQRHVLSFLTEAIQAHRNGSNPPSLLPGIGGQLAIAA